MDSGNFGVRETGILGIRELGISEAVFDLVGDGDENFDDTGTVVLEGLGLDGSKISVIVEEVKPVLGFTSLFERPEGL